MIEYATAISGLKALLDWTKLVGDAKGKKTERDRAALESLMSAVTATRHYLAAVRDDSHARSPEKSSNCRICGSALAWPCPLSRKALRTDSC